MTRFSATRSQTTLPAEIHSALVETLFGTVGSFVSGLVGGLLVPAVAWARTRDPIFLVCTVVLLFLAALRLAVFYAYVRKSDEVRHEEAARWERLYALGGIGFMFGVGLT